MVTYKVGTGLVVARREDGSWSPPSAISSFGVGWGPQVKTLYLLNYMSFYRYFLTSSQHSFFFRIHFIFKILMNMRDLLPLCTP